MLSLKFFYFLLVSFFIIYILSSAVWRDVAGVRRSFCSKQIRRERFSGVRRVPSPGPRNPSVYCYKWMTLNEHFP